MYKIVTILNLIFALCVCEQLIGQIKPDFIIDENIKEEVERNISDSLFGEEIATELFLLYENKIIVDYYEKDSLVMTTKNRQDKMPFRSFFYVRGDTISIDGVYGLFGGFGFSIKFIDKKPIIYHLLAGDDFPEYSKTKEGKLEYRIEVPCSNSSLILSRIPELNEEIIYGLVEFNSEKYYQIMETYEEGESETDQRNEIRMNMKIYFKSKYIDLGKMK